MQALIIHDSLPRLAATRFLAALTPRAYVGRTSPLRLREIPDPALPAPDWAVARARLSGLCGSDYKQIFMNGRFDNPMTGFISWPQVLGHEVVGVIDEVGPGSGTEVSESAWCSTPGSRVRRAGFPSAGGASEATWRSA